MKNPNILKITIGIPAYNEENNIAAIITKLKKITNSIIVCDDGSSDMTAEISPSEMGMDISTEILIKASSKDLKISEVPITILYPGNTSTHNPVSHGTSVLISTIKFTAIEHPLKFYGIPSLIFLVIGLIFTYSAIDFYVEFGRLSTNLSLIGASTVLIGVVLLITAILLYSLVNVVREKRY